MTAPSSHPSRLLRISLRANALFSLSSGVTMLAAAAPLSALLGLGDPLPVTAVGLNLVVFAALLVWLAARREIRQSLAMAVVMADLLWVGASAALLPTGIFSTAGAWIVLVVADIVLVFALLQALGIRRLRRCGWATAT